MLTPGERNKRAMRARAALNDPAIMEVLDELYADAVASWAATDLIDATKREITYFQLLGITQIRQQLKNWSRDTERTGDK